MNPDADKLVNENKGLAYEVARRVHEKYPLLADIDDLQSAAMEALWRAAQKYDPRRGYAFSTVVFKYCFRDCAKSFSRRRKWHRRGVRQRPLSAVPWRLMTDFDTPVAELMRQENRVIARVTIRRAMEQLDPTSREVLLGRLNGEPLWRIGERIGKSKELVRRMEAGIFAWIRGEQANPKPKLNRGKRAVRLTRSRPPPNACPALSA